MAFDEASDYDLILSMKRDNSYSFTYPLEYIISRVGDEAYSDDDYVLGKTTIDVRLDWQEASDSQAPGYRLSYRVNDYDRIPIEFNGSEPDLLDQKWFDIQSDLRSAGIDVRAVDSSWY